MSRESSRCHTGSEQGELIGTVVRAIPREHVSDIIVADGGSGDATREEARLAGATVVDAGRGYGRACYMAMVAATDADVMVFMDGDGADDPQCIASLVAPIQANDADFVIGSRVRGSREPGSIAWHQIGAGLAAGYGMRLVCGVRYTECARSARSAATH